jgi:hypothetical protein
MGNDTETTKFQAKILAKAKIGPDSADTLKVMSYIEPGVKLSSALGAASDQGLAQAGPGEGLVDRLERGLEAKAAKGDAILDVVS